MNKRTEWFAGSVRPDLAGVYERDYRSAVGSDCSIGIAFCHWNGYQWGLFGVSADEAYHWKIDRTHHQNLPWRGLAENPEK